MGAISKQVGRRIKALRVYHQLSQEQLAEQAGISAKYLGEVERGTGNISIEKLSDIAKALDLPVNALVDADHEQQHDELVNKIIAFTPKLSPKDAQIVYRLIKMLTGQ